MSDRKLLEMATKGAGIQIIGLVNDMIAQPDHRKNGFIIRNDRGGDSCWNPLTDDGDALRLAVKLGLDVCIDSRQENEPHTHVIGFRDDNTSTTIDAIESHGDPYDATRRAIVRAAAEIGKNL